MADAVTASALDDLGDLHHWCDVGVVGHVSHHIAGQWRAHGTLERIKRIKGHVHSRFVRSVNDLVDLGANWVPGLGHQGHMGGAVVIVIEGRAFA